MESVRKLIDKYGMLPRGGKVIAAVSGGADSMCLLHLLLDLRDEYGYELIAAHFNHMLRGDNADRDEGFVREHCGSIGVEIVCGRGDTRKFASENGLSIEEAARELRYRFFEETAQACGAYRRRQRRNGPDEHVAGRRAERPVRDPTRARHIRPPDAGRYQRRSRRIPGGT